MKRAMLLVSVTIACVGMDCQGNLPAGSQIPGTSNCKLEEGPGFTMNIPCAAVSSGRTDLTPGFSFEKLFVDDSTGDFYSVEVVTPESVASGMTGANLGSGGNLRLEGTRTTFSGDTILIATLRLDFVDLLRAVTFLADGSFLRVSIGSPSQTRDQMLLTLASIDVLDSDGRGILHDGEEESTRMLAPFLDEFLLLDDMRVWRIATSDKLQVSGWTVGDPVFALAADAFSSVAFFSFDAFLTQIPEWLSVPVSFVSNADLVEIIAIQQDFCTTIQLSDGNDWTACTDSAVLDGMSIGQQVAVFDISGSSARLMNLITGRTAFVID